MLPARLRHLLAVFAENDSLIHQALERLRFRQITEIEKHFVPEARVKKMQHCVFGSADVKIDAARFVAAHPVAFGFFANEPLIVLRIAKSQVIPARARPLRHRVCFTHRLVGITNPIFCFRQRRFAGAGRFVIIKGGGTIGNSFSPSERCFPSSQTIGNGSPQ